MGEYMKKNMFKERILYGILTLSIMILGLASRKLGTYLPEFVRLYAGDTLWAMMVYFGLRFLSPPMKVYKAVCIALLFSFGIEISQLYQAQWINHIRETTFGALVLGRGFLWSDLICYTVGIILGGGINISLSLIRNQIRIHQKDTKIRLVE